MFEHLDDTEPFTPDPGFRAAAKRRGRSRRRRTWLVRGGATAVLVAVAGVGTSLALVDRQLDRVERVHVAGLAPEPEAPAEPYTVLFVGADSDAGLAADDPVRGGRDGVDGERTDTMVLVAVDPAAERLTVLPLPRDLYVDIPGHGPQRLNAAFSFGGPSLLIDAIQERFDVAVNHYVEVDFAGAMAIADEVGGLRLSFPSALRDLRSGLSVEAGCQTLDGRSTLALARSRYAQYRRPDGSWRSDPTSDLGRIERQQAVATALLASFSHVDTRSPTALAGLLDAVARHVTVDASISNDDLVELFRDVAGTTIDQLRLPVVDAVHGGADVLDPAAGTDDVVARFRAAGAPATTTTAPPTSGHGPTTATTTTTAAPTTPPVVPNTPAEALPTPC